MTSVKDAASAAASTSAAAHDVPTPSAPPTPPTPSLMATWGNISFSAPPRSVRVREMLIPEAVRDAARVLIDALDGARADRVIALEIGCSGRAWPRSIPQTVDNAEFLRIALRRELERRGQRVVSGTPAAGVWQLSPLYGRDTVAWRFRIVAPRRTTDAART